MAFIHSKKNSTQGNKAAVEKRSAVTDLNMTKTVNDGTTATATTSDPGAPFFQSGFEEKITGAEGLGLRGGDGGAGGPGAYCLVM